MVHPEVDLAVLVFGQTIAISSCFTDVVHGSSGRICTSVEGEFVEEVGRVVLLNKCIGTDSVKERERSSGQANGG